MVVNYTVGGGTFVKDKPRLWSDHFMLSNGAFKNYDLSTGGKRFARVEPPADQRPTTHVNLPLDYFLECTAPRAGPNNYLQPREIPITASLEMDWRIPSE